MLLAASLVIVVHNSLRSTRSNSDLVAYRKEFYGYIFLFIYSVKQRSAIYGTDPIDGAQANFEGHASVEC